MIPHGQYSKYSNDGCRCEACKRAWADYQLDLRFRRQYHGQVTAPTPHGTTTGYQQYRCRCDDCCRASHEDYLRRRERAKVQEGRQ